MHGYHIKIDSLTLKAFGPMETYIKKNLLYSPKENHELHGFSITFIKFENI
jgi:hypothetical protein